METLSWRERVFVLFKRCNLNKENPQFGSSLSRDSKARYTTGYRLHTSSLLRYLPSS